MCGVEGGNYVDSRMPRADRDLENLEFDLYG